MTIAVVGFVRAEDDEDEEDDDEDDRSKIEYVTETVIVKPAQIVTEIIMKNFVVRDSDKDGLLDENDPHPDVPEMLIVKDENKNGIVDSYEL